MRVLGEGDPDGEAAELCCGTEDLEGYLPSLVRKATRPVRATSTTKTAVSSSARRRTRDAPPGFVEREAISGPGIPAC